MASAIDSLGKAVRHGIVVRVECRGCGNVRQFASHELMMMVGGRRDPLSLKFRCKACAPAGEGNLARAISAARTGRTLGDVIDAGESLYVNCHDPRCQHSAQLGLDALVQRLRPGSRRNARRPCAAASDAPNANKQTGPAARSASPAFLIMSATIGCAMRYPIVYFSA